VLVDVVGGASVELVVTGGGVGVVDVSGGGVLLVVAGGGVGAAVVV